MIDPEFDPFKQQMPLRLMFHRQIANSAIERIAELNALCKIEFGKIYRPDGSGDFDCCFDFRSPRVMDTLLGADSYRPLSLTFDGQTDIVQLEVELFNDGSPYVREEDVALLRPHNSSFAPDSYFIFTSRELPPFAAISWVVENAEKVAEEEHRGLLPEPDNGVTGYYQRIVSIIQQNGYSPYILQNSDCETLVTAIHSYPLDAIGSMAIKWGDYEINAPNAVN